MSESLSFKDAPARESFKARRASKGVFASQENATLACFEDPAFQSASKGVFQRRASKGVFASQEKATLAGASGSEGASGFEDPALRDSLAGASLYPPFPIASESFELLGFESFRS
jgi:hypothetical protein